MTIIETSQIMTVLAFLGLMGLAWAAVYVNRAKLKGKVGANRRLTICEATSIGPGERAILLEADGQTVLAVLPRKGGAQLLPLSKPAAEENAE